MKYNIKYSVANVHYDDFNQFNKISLLKTLKHSFD